MPFDPQGQSRAHRILGVAGLCLLLAAYASFLHRNFEPAITEADANGYWAQGSLLVKTGHTWFRPQSDAQFIGAHWLLSPAGDYVSRYPPGLPMVIGIVFALFGYKASVLANPVLAILTIAGFYLAARQILKVPWSLMAALLLMFDPTFTQHALANDSHMAVAFCIVWGLYLLLRWSKQGHAWQIFLAGLVFGCIPTIRYPDSIMGLAVLVYILMHWRQRPWIGLHLFAGAAGAAIPILPLLVRNQFLLGAFWRTGYSLTNEQTGFGFNYLREHWAGYIHDLNSDALGLLFALGITAIILMLCLPAWRRLGVLFSLLTVPMLLLYMAYYWTAGGFGTMRFLVPTLPCYVLASVWLIERLSASAPRPARVVLPMVLVLVQCAWASQSLGERPQMRRSKQALVAVTDALHDIASPGDLILSQNIVLQHLDFVREWKLADPEIVTGRGRGPRGGFNGPGFAPGFAARGGRGARGAPPAARGPVNDDPDAPSPRQFAKNQAQREHYAGPNPQRQFTRDVVSWAGDANLYLIGSEEEINQTAEMLDYNSTLQLISRIPLPPDPEPEEFQPGRRGGGPMVGRGGRGGRGPGGRGGPMANAFAGDSEVVIARWKPTTQP